MTTDTTLIAARVASLPISRAERSEALAYVSAGESLAEAVLSIARWLESSPVLKPTYQD